MPETETKIFYGIHGGIVSGVYETLESCIASHGKYKAFDNFIDARTFACTGMTPEDIKTKKEEISFTEKVKKTNVEKEPHVVKKVHYAFEAEPEKDKENTDDSIQNHNIIMKDDLANGLRQIADTLEKEKSVNYDRLEEEIKKLSDKIYESKPIDETSTEKNLKLHKISVEIEDLITLIKQEFNI